MVLFDPFQFFKFTASKLRCILKFWTLKTNGSSPTAEIFVHPYLKVHCDTGK